MIFSVDPGPVESAYVMLDSKLKPIEFGKLDNYDLVGKIAAWNLLGEEQKDEFAIEMVASYGMPVGVEVFETVFWIGRFWEAACNFKSTTKIYRKDEKINLCGSMKAKDSNIRQALIDRFGGVGVKKNPGWFYGVSGDVWSAIAVGVTYHDKYIKGAA